MREFKSKDAGTDRDNAGDASDGGTVDKGLLIKDPISGSDREASDQMPRRGGIVENAEIKKISLAEFVSEFYISKQPPSEQFKKTFGDLEDVFHQSEQDSLLLLAAKNDSDLNRTLLLAEFLLETSIRRNYRDKLIHFIQAVSSNVGSLSRTSRLDEFQNWLDGCGAARNKLERFVSNINKIVQEGSEKPLPLRQRNNLISIAAIWLFTKSEIDIPQLITVLRNEGMNLDGETGPNNETKAFSYVASMIRSSSKKRFAYFLDWTDRSRRTVEAALDTERGIRISQAREIDSLNIELARQRDVTKETNEELRIQKLELEKKQAKLVLLEKEIGHREIHHGADKTSANARYRSSMKELLKAVELAETALDKEKYHVVKYQLETLSESLRKELL